MGLIPGFIPGPWCCTLGFFCRCTFLTFPDQLLAQDPHSDVRHLGQAVCWSFESYKLPVLPGAPFFEKKSCINSKLINCPDGQLLVTVTLFRGLVGAKLSHKGMT